MVFLLKDELATALGMSEGAVNVRASVDKAVVKIDVAGESGFVAGVFRLEMFKKSSVVRDA